MLLLLQTPAPAVRAAVDRIVAAHTRLTSFEAKIVRANTPTSTLARSGSGVWLRFSDTSGLFPTVRTLCAKANAGWAYDGFLAELVPAQVKGGTPFERLVSVTGAPDDAVRLLLEPTTLAAYLRGLSKRAGSKLVASTLSFPIKGDVTRVTFDPTSRRIVRLVTSAGGTKAASGAISKGLDVRYQYGFYGLAGFTPVGARGVVRPTALTPATTFDGAAARRALGRMISRNARLARVNVAVETEDADYRVVAVNGSIRQIGPQLDLGYDGKTLVVVDRKAGKTYRGAAKRSDVRRVAARLGEPLLPLTAAFLSRSLPFAGVLFPPRRVAIGATTPDGGGNTDVLKLVARGTRATVFVRSDGLVTSLESEERDASGRAVAFARQRYRYTTEVGSPGLPTSVGTIAALPKPDPVRR